MRIPFWKKWLSHLFPITLESASTEINPSLAVRLDRGRVQLLSGNAIYSWDDLYRNFTVAFGQMNLPSGGDTDVLLLGLGLGSVPYILEKVYGKKYQYTAVEIDAAVADMASRYTLSRVQSPVQLIVADASVYLDVCEDRFDMVIVDIFEDHIVPAQFESVEFLEDCLALLNPHGRLIFNRLYNTTRDRRDTERYYREIFKEVFPDAICHDVRGNWVLEGRKEEGS